MNRLLNIINKGINVPKKSSLHDMMEFTINNQEVQNYINKPGTDVNIRNSLGKTPLNMLISNLNNSDSSFSDFLENVLFYNTIIGSRILISGDNEELSKPSYEIVLKSYKEKAEVLIAAPDSDINSADKEGRTPLHEAANFSRAKIEKDFTLFCNTNNLHLGDATELGKPMIDMLCNTLKEIFIVLLRNGADLLKTDKNGQTPIDIADESLMEIIDYYKQMQVLYQEAGVLASMKTKTPLTEAMKVLQDYTKVQITKERIIKPHNRPTQEALKEQPSEKGRKQLGVR